MAFPFQFHKVFEFAPHGNRRETVEVLQLPTGVLFKFVIDQEPGVPAVALEFVPGIEAVWLTNDGQGVDACTFNTLPGYGPPLFVKGTVKDFDCGGKGSQPLPLPDCRAIGKHEVEYASAGSGEAHGVTEACAEEAPDGPGPGHIQKVQDDSASPEI